MVHRDLIKAAAVVVGVACATGAWATAAPPAAPAAAASHGPGWKQIFENGQVIYYIGASELPKSGEGEVTTLLEYKIPQVIGGSQVWSIVSHMRLRCDAQQMVTADNTLYARPMGGGPVVETQPANDSWHQPQPGSLGGLVWRAACAKP